MSLNCVRGLNHKYPQRLHLLQRGDPLSGPIGADIRLGLHPIDHWPLFKVMKHFIYILSRPPMSMNCVRGLNHKYPPRLHLLHQGDPLSGPIGADIRLELHLYDH